jgi:hypothetical protein
MNDTKIDRQRGLGITDQKMGSERMDAQEDNAGGGMKLLVAAVVMIGIVAAVYAGYRVHLKDDATNQAQAFASSFIRSSPVVQAHLGTVENVKEIKEERRLGSQPGLYLDYEVTGRRAGMAWSTCG